MALAFLKTTASAITSPKFTKWPIKYSSLPYFLSQPSRSHVHYQEAHGFPSSWNALHPQNHLYMFDFCSIWFPKTTHKVNKLCSLESFIAASMSTIDTALANLPYPAACSFLFCAIETTISSINPNTPSASVIGFFQTHPSLFSHYSPFHPDKWIYDVWQTPSNNPAVKSTMMIPDNINSNLNFFS